jgi:hypothetical protein
MRHRCRRVSWGLAILGAAVIAPSAFIPATSLADGDPASDYLLAEDVFFPFQPKVDAALERALNATVRAAHTDGLPLKVALIGTAQELGLVTNLFGHPQEYAAFLYREISFNERPELLVVMPVGFGVVPTRLAAALKGVPVHRGESSNGLARSALLAVVALARAQGHTIVAPRVGSSSSRGSPRALLLFGLPAVLLALVGLWMALRRPRAQKREEDLD